jgi:hypothetical protein
MTEVWIGPSVRRDTDSEKWVTLLDPIDSFTPIRNG